MAISLVGILCLTSLVGIATTSVPSGGPGRSNPTGSLDAARPVHYPSHRSCDGMYWSPGYSAKYTPSFCYGHDEPTMSYESTAPGTGANASFPIVLPNDSASYAQGDFYATIWFGGTVFDLASTAGGNQAFLELQFYPAAPYYTGPGSGHKDCLSDGAYFPYFSAGTNRWFACAIVWQLANSGGGVLEDAAYAGPIDVSGGSSILEMKSGDHVLVNYSGIAQSTTTPWNISVSDASSGSAGWAPLQNGTLVLSPFYSTAASGNTLHWGASNPGAIAFAYEIGHAYTVGGSCAPGDGVCDSYWPGRWAASGPAQIGLPELGSPGSMTYPTRIAFSSSQGGEYEVNASSCRSPSTSTSTNCLYPYYIYRSGSYSFDFATSRVANDTHDYGNLYQFPSSLTAGGQWAPNTELAPWGTVHFVVYPTNATATFAGIGGGRPLAFAANRTASGQYLEGLYWFNVTAPGCTSATSSLYLATASVHNLSVFLPCGGSNLTAHASATPTSGLFPLTVAFNGTATGGTAPYAYSWTFGDGSTSTLARPSHVYSTPGAFAVSLIVSDANGSGSLATLNVSAHEPSCAGTNLSVALGAFQYCHLNKSQHAAFTFVVTRSGWTLNAAVVVYALSGTVTGSAPVFKLGTGIGGTPSLGSAKQTSAGRNAGITITLLKKAANKYGGWGTYWAYVNATGGSGGFCFVAAYQNQSIQNAPSCSKAVDAPRTGGAIARPTGMSPGRSPGSPGMAIDRRSAAVVPTSRTGGAAPTASLAVALRIEARPAGRP